jgi:hypothetical protein
MTFGKMRKYSITLVIISWSDSRKISTIIAFSDCILQSSQIWCWCQKNFILNFFWWIRGWPPVVVFQQRDGVFILYLWWLLSQYGVNSSYEIKISIFFFFQMLCAYAWSCDLPSNSLICWALNQALAPSCPWWQSSSLVTLIESHRTCISYADVGLSSLNPILISLVQNLVDLSLQRVLPRLFSDIVPSCSSH